MGSRLCGVDIEEVFSAGPAWPPVGLTLLVNSFRGRLHFQATYAPECVADEVPAAFLDELLADLLGD